MSAGWALAVLLAAGSTCAARADIVPAKGMVDPRIRTALYSADEVYRLRGAVGYVIELIFEDGEFFTGRAGGDLEAVAIDGYEHWVHLKPRVAVVATNLVIYTNRRAYRFDYSASTAAPGRGSEEVMYAVRFRYPADPVAASAESASERITERLARATATRPRNFHYGYCGHPALKPVAASDDGVHTHLAFGPRAELPAIFVRNDDGSESLLNFSVENGSVVIHRVARQFIVRRGRLAGCVVNQGFAGTGERLESGTLSPDVRRDRRELGP